MVSETISMEPVGEKLRDIGRYFPGDQLSRYQFGAYPDENMLFHFEPYLADRLGPELDPRGFVTKAVFTLYELERGVDAATHQPIRNELVGLPGTAYQLLLASIPVITDAVCPEDFATYAKDIYEAVFAPALDDCLKRQGRIENLMRATEANSRMFNRVMGFRRKPE